MNKTFTDGLGTKGHLTIHKIANGEEELLFDDKNVIVSGFGWALANLYGKAGSTTVTDYQIDRFQLGVSGSLANQESSTYELSGPLSSTEEYTTNGDSNLYAVSADAFANGVINGTQSVFAKIPFSKVTKIDERSVRYTIFIDEDSCNNISRNSNLMNLNEIALWVKNPLGRPNDASVMAAYRYFSNIRKTSDFGLVFRWTITFG
tara:strand:- start:1496 stop:2110 length:615 start_codon:yes stop_codon:yes gene_type:complete